MAERVVGTEGSSQTFPVSTSLGFSTPAAALRGYLVLLGGMFRGTLFRFPLNPEKLEMSRRPKYEDHQVPGTSEEISHYVSGSQLGISMKVRLEAKSEIMYLNRVGVFYKTRDGQAIEPLSRSKELVDGGQKLLQCYSFLDSLCLARKPDSITNLGAPPFLFVWGPKMRFTCTMRSVTVEWVEFQPGTNTPIRGDVSLEMNAYVRGGMTHEERLVYTDQDLLTAAGSSGAKAEKKNVLPLPPSVIASYDIRPFGVMDVEPKRAAGTGRAYALDGSDI